MSRKFIPTLLTVVAAMTVTAPNALAGGSLTVTKTPGAGAGTVTGTVPDRDFEGEGPRTIINCGSDCSESAIPDYQTCIVKPSGDEICTDHEESVTLTQQPATGWQLTGWSGCTSVTGGGACQRTMNGNKTVTANYADVGAPTAAVTGPVEDAKLNGIISVGAVAGDNVGVTHVKFFINNVEIADDTFAGDGWSTSFTTDTLPHAQAVTVKVVAFDAAGNQSVLEDDDDRGYRIDRQTGVHFEAPTPAEGEWVGAADASVEVNFVKNTDTPADTVSFECNLGGGFSSCSSPLSGSNFGSDGTYTVTVKGTDDATPVPNTAQVTRSFKIDRTLPAVSLTRPAEGSIQPKAFTPVHPVTEANPADTAPVTCSLDGGTYGPCGALSGLAAGQHAYSVKAVDKAGNQRIVTNDFTVDGTPPAVSITAGPRENEIVRSNAAAFAFSAADPSAPLTRSCRIDGAFGACSSPTSHSRSGLSEGAHVFEVRVADAAGNATTVRRNFVVNAVRPTVAIVDGPAEGAVIKATETTFRFAAVGGNVQCSLDSEAGYGPCSTGDSHTVRGLGDGGHTFRVRVRDASNDEVVQSRTFTVDTSEPPRPKEVVNTSLSSGYKAFRKFTVYKRLVLKGVPDGATVTVTCKGKKCPKKRFTTRKAGDVKLGRFAKKKLRAGTTLTIRVTKPGSIGKQFVIKIRKAKTPKLSISQIA